jgi:hypothetical protein
MAIYCLHKPYHSHSLKENEELYYNLIGRITTNEICDPQTNQLLLAPNTTLDTQSINTLIAHDVHEIDI